MLRLAQMLDGGAVDGGGLSRELEVHLQQNLFGVKFALFFSVF